MESELPHVIETEIKPRKYNGALVHGYWLSQAGDKTKEHLDQESHVAARAAAHVYHEEGIGKIVLLIGKVWGPKYKTVGQLMQYDLVHKYKIPQEDIILIDESLNTNSEIDVFGRLAKTYGWKNMVDIASQEHLWNIPDLFKKLHPELQAESGVNIDFRSVEEILGGYNKTTSKSTLDTSDSRGVARPDERVANFMKKRSRSRYRLGRALYNLAKVGLVKTGKEDVLNKRLNPESNVKGPVFFGDKISLPMSDYKLEYDEKAAKKRKEEGYSNSKEHLETVKKRNEKKGL